MTQSSYNQAVREAASRLPAVPSHIHPAAQDEFARVTQAAAEALAEEKDPAKQQHMAQLYTGFLHEYARFAVQSDHAIKNMPPPQALQHAKAMNYAYWHHFHTGEAATSPLGNFSWATTMPQLTHNDPNSPARVAFEKLSDKMRGPNMMKEYFFDSRKAKDEDSTLSGMRWGKIAGFAGGFAAGGFWGLKRWSMWDIIARIGTGLGVSALVGYLTEDKKEPVPTIVTPPYREAQASTGGYGQLGEVIPPARLPNMAQPPKGGPSPTSFTGP